MLGCNDGEILPEQTTSVFQPNQVHSAIVDRSIPVVITPDVVSSSEAVSCFIPTTSWDKRFQELETYKQENSDTNVPQHYDKNKPLGNWVLSRRNQYKLSKENRRNEKTKECI